MSTRKVITLFILYSFLGWILDSLVRSIVEGYPVEGSAFGIPLCPIYGFGGLALTLLAPRIKKLHIAWQFVTLAIGLAVFEFGGGAFSEMVFGKRLWDYASMPMNLAGYTDFAHAIGWGVLGLIFIHYIYPFVQSKIKAYV